MADKKSTQLCPISLFDDALHPNMYLSGTVRYIRIHMTAVQYSTVHIRSSSYTVRVTQQYPAVPTHHTSTHYSPSVLPPNQTMLVPSNLIVQLHISQNIPSHLIPSRPISQKAPHPRLCCHISPPQPPPPSSPQSPPQINKSHPIPKNKHYKARPSPKNGKRLVFHLISRRIIYS